MSGTLRFYEADYRRIHGGLGLGACVRCEIDANVG